VRSFPTYDASRVYHESVRTLSQRVADYIHEHRLMSAGDRVGLAVSGGADSVAMLRLMLELRETLGIVVHVVHFNHKLRGAESDGDEMFVADLARAYGLEFHRGSGDAAEYARAESLSLETAARTLRYRFFRQLLEGRVVNSIATAHTLNDQAETVLLKLIRGAGSRGLAGIYPRLQTEAGPVVRPLLGARREEVEVYLGQVGQDWREDVSNRDPRHTRNRVRHGLLPRLKSDFNPAIVEVLSDTADVFRSEEDYWSEKVLELLADVWRTNLDGGRLDRAALGAQPVAVQRRLIRACAEEVGLALDFKHVEAVRNLGRANSSKKNCVLPYGWRTQLEGKFLIFSRPGADSLTDDFDLLLPIPGRVDLPQVGIGVEAVPFDGDGDSSYNRERSELTLLDVSKLTEPLRVRNWRAGDRYWPAHGKGPRKMKELLQRRHLAVGEKKLWPVVTCGERLIWAHRFPVSEEFRATQADQSILIREMPLE